MQTQKTEEEMTVKPRATELETKRGLRQARQISRREWMRNAASATAALVSAGSLRAWGDARTTLSELAAKRSAQQANSPAKIQFSLQTLPFRLDSDETLNFPHAPATMAGGVAVFDYNKDGRPDIFFTNGANIETLKKDSPRFSNRLFRNDGNGSFTDVTQEAGLAGTGYDIAAAVGDYDNDGHPDLFVGGVHGRTLYHNNGDGTFSNVTAKAGLDRVIDPQYGPLWMAAAAWVDVNNDGLLDLVVINYLQWDAKTEKLCPYVEANDYCTPRLYQGQPNQLFLNRGDGTFEDVRKSGACALTSAREWEWGSRTTISMAAPTSLSRTTPPIIFYSTIPERSSRKLAFRRVWRSWKPAISFPGWAWTFAIATTMATRTSFSSLSITRRFRFS